MQTCTCDGKLLCLHAYVTGADLGGFLRYPETSQVVLHEFEKLQNFSFKYSNRAVNYPNSPVTYCSLKLLNLPVPTQ